MNGFDLISLTMSLQKKKITKFLETNSFTKFDTIFISAMALFEGKLFKKSLKKIEEMIPILKVEKDNRDYYLLYYYLKGAILRGLKKNDRARDMLEKAISQEGNCSVDALYAIPYAYCELAELVIDELNYDQAEAYLKKAKTFKKYDWERLVVVRISSLTQKVQKRKKDLKKMK